MAQNLTPSEPGADQLDEGIHRLRAMKTTLGLVLARALEAAHHRFLALGSTLSVLGAKVLDLEARDNIHWPTLEERLQRIENSTASSAAVSAHDRLLEGFEARITALEAARTDQQMRAGMHDNRATVALLRAALSVLDPQPLTYRDLYERHMRRAPDPPRKRAPYDDITRSDGT